MMSRKAEKWKKWERNHERQMIKQCRLFSIKTTRQDKIYGACYCFKRQWK